ncbi:MAG: hypothetical protein HLUCCO16_20055 [Phormidium sp. OSCR]|nr:MAG: hypothetical protein HLUCCO16_20055 [Phormidium sp. OSCR]
MVLTTVTDAGFDVGLATESDERVIMAQLFWEL